jgi:hypothetical protein
MEARYISHTDIDFRKWDQCIDESHNSLVYAYSWYLIALVDEWDAVVLGDYQTVFPIINGKKWGISYLYQPYFCQQLGLFSKSPISREMAESMLKAIPSRFRYWDIQLNSENAILGEFYELKARTTFHLPLDSSYEELSSGYSKDARKSIRKAGNTSGWSMQSKEDLEPLIIDYREAYGGKVNKIDEENYLRFKIAVEEAKNRGMAEVLEVLDENGSRMAGGVFLKSKGYYHYVFGAPTKEGRERNSTHLLIDMFIKKHAGEKMILDFEGSEIPSVAYFYKKFNPVAAEYYQLRRNNLPFFLKWIKKS